MSRLVSLFFILTITTTIAIAVTGCGPAKLKTTGQSPPESKLNCGPRRALAIFEDSNHDQLFSSDEVRGVIQPYTGVVSAASNYNYFDLSSHILIGPKTKADVTMTYFYEGPEGLSFAFTHDLAGVENRNRELKVEMVTSRNHHLDSVLLSDEPDEFKIADHSEESTYYLGNFKYALNTDGAVIGPFDGEEFQLRFRVSSAETRSGVEVASSAGKSVTLASHAHTEFEVRYQVVDHCLFP